MVNLPYGPFGTSLNPPPPRYPIVFTGMPVQSYVPLTANRRSGGWGIGGGSNHVYPLYQQSSLPPPYYYADAPVVPQHLPSPQLDCCFKEKEIQINLSDPEFKPTDAKGDDITRHILDRPATSTKTKGLTITCAIVPQWPIMIGIDKPGYTPNQLNPPPVVTVEDVLKGIHDAMQTRITHEEWHKLDHDQQKTTNCVFTGRYKMYEPYSTLSGGVKRVDYLGQNFWFGGLSMEHGDKTCKGIQLNVGPGKSPAEKPEKRKLGRRRAGESRDS